MTKPNLISLPETARLFGVSVRTIRNWMDEGLNSYPFKRDGVRSGYGFVVAEVADFGLNRKDRRRKNVV